PCIEKVDQLECVAEIVRAEEQLDAAVTVAEVGEHGLPVRAEREQSPCHAHTLTRATLAERARCFLFLEACARRCRVVGDLEAIRIRLDPATLQLLDLRDPVLDDLAAALLRHSPARRAMRHARRTPSGISR